MTPEDVHGEIRPDGKNSALLFTYVRIIVIPHRWRIKLLGRKGNVIS